MTHIGTVGPWCFGFWPVANSFLQAFCDWFQWIRMRRHDWQVSFLVTLLPLRESLLALLCSFWVRVIAFVLHNWSVEVLFCAVILHLIIISMLNSIAATLDWSLDRFIKPQRLSSYVSSTTRIPPLILHL